MAELKYASINQRSASVKSKTDSPSILSRLAKTRLFAPLVAGVFALTMAATALADSKPMREETPRGGEADTGKKKDAAPKTGKKDEPVLVADAKPMDNTSKTLDDQGSAKPKTGMDQGDAGHKKRDALDPELAKLSKVSLEEIQRLADATDANTEYRKSVVENEKGFFTILNVPIEGGRLAASVRILNDGSEFPSLIIMANGQPVTVPEIDLSELARLYKKATGNDLKYVRLVAETGNDKDVGPWVNVTVVPVEEPNGRIISGIPQYATSFYQGVVHHGPEFITP